MNDEPVNRSRSPPGEIADAPSDGDIVNLQITGEEGRERGYLIRWKTSIGAYIMADSDSHESLDENL